MNLILKEEVPKLGSPGDIVDVKPGYGRNYLIPRNLAVIATQGAIRQAEALRRAAALKAELTAEAARELAARLEDVTLTIPVTTGEDDKIHGTVTTIRIAELLEEREIFVDRRKISLDQEIRTLGEYTATIELLSDLKPKVKIWVVKDD